MCSVHNPNIVVYILETPVAVLLHTTACRSAICVLGVVTVAQLMLKSITSPTSRVQPLYNVVLVQNTNTYFSIRSSNTVSVAFH